MAAYLPMLAVLAAGATWWHAAMGMTIAVTALAVIRGVYRWGHPRRQADRASRRRAAAATDSGPDAHRGTRQAIHVSAAVGAFLVGLTLTGETARRARTLLTRFATCSRRVFFVAIGLAAG